MFVRVQVWPVKIEPKASKVSEAVKQNLKLQLAGTSEPGSWLDAFVLGCNCFAIWGQRVEGARGTM